MTSEDSRLRTVMRSDMPFLRMFMRAISARWRLASMAVTWRAPTLTAIMARSPEPVPISTTTESGLTHADSASW